MNQISQSDVKILVVDDEIDLEDMMRLKFRRQIREKILILYLLPMDWKHWPRSWKFLKSVLFFLILTCRKWMV